MERIWKDQSGQGLVEYVFIIAFLALAATAGMSSVATAVNSSFTRIGVIFGDYIS